MSEGLDSVGLRSAAAGGRIQWRRHSLERMLERGITRERVRRAILLGDVIEVYAGDRPYPSGLILHVEEDALHVVTAYDPRSGICHVITTYRPDSDHFGDDLRTRRQGR